MSYVICASPLAKIFNPIYHNILIENPAVIRQETPFHVRVLRPAGDLVFQYNQPQWVEARDRTDTKALVQWLTSDEGGRTTEETDLYGLVRLNLTPDFFQASSQLQIVQAMIGSNEKEAEEAKRQAEKIDQETRAKLTKELLSARALADERVMTMIRRVHNNAAKQQQYNMEQGLGKVYPSATELLGVQVLQDEIKRYTESRQKLMETYNESMSRVVNVG